jgi:hypothetical protein
MMHWLILTIVATALIGCSASSEIHTTTRPAPDRLFSGILVSGQMAIGGEHTGWSLVDAAGHELHEVDVSAVAEQANAAQNREVSIAGQLQSRHHVERGDTTVVVAHRITITEP